ncbi:MAG: hypothetical protein KBT45_07995 [Bacteroidales bacterium]|nr:hypothetical protein [Candidatus Colimorpha pelethequi]MCQ2262609.1 hypothetical protein [Bacteroidales bacterium]
MDNIEITKQPFANPESLQALRTLGYDDNGNLLQVRLANLKTATISAVSIDFRTGSFYACRPFVAGSSEVFVNGLRYAPDTDYQEISDGSVSKGFIMPGIEPDDEIVLKATLSQ